MRKKRENKIPIHLNVAGVPGCPEFCDGVTLCLNMMSLSCLRHTI